jgi:hypothetical protein
MYDQDILSDLCLRFGIRGTLQRKNTNPCLVWSINTPKISDLGPIINYHLGRPGSPKVVADSLKHPQSRGCGWKCPAAASVPDQWPAPAAGPVRLAAARVDSSNAGRHYQQLESELTSARWELHMLHTDFSFTYGTCGCLQITYSYIRVTN